MPGKRKGKSKRDFRIDILIAINILVAGIIIYRLFFIQVLNHDFYVALAEDQHHIFEDLVPERGEIFAQDKYSDELYPLASNQKLYLVYAVPRQVQDPASTAAKLAAIFPLSVESPLSRIQMNLEWHASFH